MASSLLSWKWVIESLAGVPDVGNSVLSAVVERFPDVLDDSSGAIKERVALRYLEEFAGTACEETPPPLSTNDASTSSYAAGMNAAQTCEEVLRSKILLHEDSTSNGSKDGKPALLGGDLHQFILLKKATLPKSSIELLKERVLGSYPTEDKFLKDYNGLPKNTRHQSNHFRGHHGKKKIKRSMKFSSPWLNMLRITRKYRRLKSRANMPSVSNGILLQKSSPGTYHVEDDKKSNEENVGDDCNEIRPLIMEEIQAKPTSERSAGFHDAKLQYLRDNAASHDDAPNSHRNNMKKALQAGQKHQRQTVLDEDSSDLHGDVVGITDDYVKMLEQSSMLMSSSVQGLCMKCGKSGHLLICCGNGCSRAIHESCLGSLARFGKDGHFYCLFCIYRNAFLIYKKAKRKALKARKNLFKHYNGGPEFDILKQRMPSAKFIINHNGNKHSDVPFNQQSTNSSNEQGHNGIMIEEENHTTLSDVNHNKVLENQTNWHNGSTDFICKELHLCRESIECDAQVVLQDMPLNLLDETDASHVLTREEEDQHTVEDRTLPTDDIVLNEMLVCGEPLQVGQRENVCADVDQERFSVQANKSSILMVEEQNKYADVAKQGPLYVLADISSGLMVQKENEHAYVTDQEPLHMLANISSLLLMEEENMHTDASIQERPSQANKISAHKMDDEHGHQPLNLQGETDACHGLMGVAQDQQHEEGNSSTVNDRLPSEIYASCNRTDDREKSFETEVCCESLQVEHRETMHAGVCDQKFPSLSANKSSISVAEDENLHADVADQERPSLVNKISGLKTDDECSHHQLNLLDETDFNSKLTTETNKQQSVEDHALIADDNLASEMCISCNRGDDGENSFESEVSRENLQVHDVVDGQKLSSVLKNRSSTFIVEEENVHADVADRLPLYMKSKKSSTLEVEEKNLHDVHAAAAHQGPPSMQTNKNSICVGGEENVHADVSDQERPSQPIKSSALQMDHECGHGTKRKELASKIKERFSKRNRRKEAIHKNDVCRETVRSLQADSSSGSNFRRCIAQKKPSSIPRGAPSRRAKCFWKPEEVKFLEEVVQKALNMDEGRISWKKILEDGRHVFHGSRTPADLKDKWRGMLKKEAISRG